MTSSNGAAMRCSAGGSLFSAALLKVLESLGPYPIQPIVVRTGLPVEAKRAIEEALLKMGSTPKGRALLDPWGCSGFAAPDEADYSSEKLLAHYGP